MGVIRFLDHAAIDRRVSRGESVQVLRELRCAETRVCSKCKESKPFPASFHRAGLNRSGVVTYRPDCADCHRELDKIAKRRKRASNRQKQGSDAAKQPKVVSLTERLEAETSAASLKGASDC